MTAKEAIKLLNKITNPANLTGAARFGICSLTLQTFPCLMP